MNASAAGLQVQDALLYQTTVKLVLQEASVLMGRVLAGGRQSLKNQATQARAFGERDHYKLALSLLENNTTALSKGYPLALADALTQAAPAGPAGPAALKDLRFDQLELMDTAQVHERVAMARAQQSVLLATDATLTEFNTYICAALDMSVVQPERNPLRPEIFVQALQNLLTPLPASAQVRLECLQHMSEALGQALSQLYSMLSAQLQKQGVTPVGYVVLRNYGGAGALRREATEVQAPAATVLTLERLRGLLAGELVPPPSPVAEFAAQFAREFGEGGETVPDSEFASTVPAALEALQEMQQVNQVIARIGQRQQKVTGADSATPVRNYFPHAAGSLAQVLSLEVVALMVENMAQDARLLVPIKQVLQDLEPALRRLALADPRFFSDKQHPARRLLLDITHRSLAYDGVGATGFSEFLAPLQHAVSQLAALPLDDGQPFEELRQALVQQWDEEQPSPPMTQAVQALLSAEERNLLADRIAEQVLLEPDAALVPAGVLDFLCNPWAQVVAHAQLNNSGGVDDPGRYRELIRALLWSAQPELTRMQVGKLTRLVPKLLAKLREGLKLIDYPATKTGEFFELLMKLHQQGMRPVGMPSAVAPVAAFPGPLQATDPWLVPDEAKASGFMALSDDASSPPVEASVLKLPLGAWVEIRSGQTWVRTQLSWVSPHDTLFLFTSPHGSTQSMTRRSRDKLLANGALRVISGQPMIEGALDAVVQSAMRNSLAPPR
jgi:hypothetical protein